MEEGKRLGDGVGLASVLRNAINATWCLHKSDTKAFQKREWPATGNVISNENDNWNFSVH